MAATRRHPPSDCAPDLFAGPAPDADCEEVISAAGVGVARISLAPHMGEPLRLRRPSLAFVESKVFDLEVAAADKSPSQDRLLPPSAMLILPADRELAIQWRARPTLLVISFDKTLVERLASEMGVKSGALHPQFGVRDDDLDTLAMKARLELDFGGASGPLFLEALGVLMAARLLRNDASSKVGRAAAGGLETGRLRRVIDHVEEQLSENLTLETLSTIAGLSAHHFASAFRASTGVSPHRYILERRIARSIERLSLGKESVTEIAHALGFSSHGHFTTSFRRHTGVTPTTFAARRRQACSSRARND